MHWNALKMNKKIHKKIKCIKAHIFSVYFLYIEMGCLKAKYMESKRMFVRLLADRFQLNARCTLPLLVRVWWVKRPPTLTLDRHTWRVSGPGRAPPASTLGDEGFWWYGHLGILVFCWDIRVALCINWPRYTCIHVFSDEGLAKNWQKLCENCPPQESS